VRKIDVEPAVKTPLNPTKDDARVRDHLANERTYLAWLRTGIATMGFGVVIAKLRWLLPSAALTPPARGILHASNIGLLFTVFGLLTVVLALQRFLVVQKQIREGRYESSGLLLTVYAALVTVLGLLILWYLLESVRVP
jgi:putative membrane protein